MGLLLVAAGFVIFKLYNALEESRRGRTSEVEVVQNARIDDAKAVQAQLVELIKTCTAAIVGAGNAQGATKESIEQLHETLDKLLDEVRRGGK